MSEIVAKSSYDVVIIGAGIAGMTASALLSRCGLSVCVLEKEPHAGGYLAGFRRQDFRFDSAIHWLNQCGDNGLVTKIFEFIGDDRPHLQTMHRINRFKGATYDYVLTNNPDELRDQLIADFPHEKKGILKLFKAAKKITKSFDLYPNMFRDSGTMSGLEKIRNGMRKLDFVRPIIRYIWYHGEEGFTKGLNLFFKDPQLHKVWSSEPDLLSVLLPIAWAYCSDYQLPPQGGSQVFIEWLEHVTNYYRNDVIFQVIANEIMVENGQCKGVRFSKKGKQYEVKAQHVIAACDVEMLYEKMLPPNLIPQKLKDNLKSAVLYSSAVAISIALDCPTEELGFEEELVLILEEDVSRKDHDSGDPHKTAISIIPPSLRDKSMAPEGKGTLTIYSSAWIDYKNYWGTQKDENGRYIRTEAYYNIKQEFADIILDRIENRLNIDIRKHIEFMDIASPITHWRYSFNRNGSIMGARPGKANMQAKIAHHQTPVSNLILGGHWSDLGGGVPIAVKAAANAAMYVLKDQKPTAFKIFSRFADGLIDVREAHQSGHFENYDNSWVQALTPAQQLKKKLDKL